MGIDYSAIRAAAHELASHRSPPPEYEPVIAALTAWFGVGVVCVLAFGLAGVEGPTKYRATTATTFIVGGLTYLWIWLKQRRYERACNMFHAMLLEEARAITRTPKSD